MFKIPKQEYTAEFKELAVTAEEMELLRVRAENARPRMENEIQKKRRRTSPRMRCEVRLDRHAAQVLSFYPLPVMCETLEVSSSGYRAWKGGGTPNRKRLTDTQLLAVIHAIHAQIKGAYGSPRILREIRARGFPVGKEAG